MAPFVRRQQVGQAPNFTSASRGSSPDTSFKTLFSGIGNLIEGGAAIRRDIVDREIKGEVETSVGRVQDQTLEDALSGAGYNVQPNEPSPEEQPQSEEETQPQGVLEQPGVFGGQIKPASYTPANTEPTELGTTFKRVEKLTNAYNSGQLSDVQYWTRMTAEAKKVRNRWPGYASKIDNQFAALTGGQPANMLRRSLIRQQQDAVASVEEDRKDFTKFVQRNAEYLPPDCIQRAQQGDPYSRAETYQHVFRRQQKEQRVQEEKAKINLAKAQGERVQEKSVQGASQEFADTVNRIIADAVPNNQSLNEFIQKKAQGGFTPDEKEELKGWINEVYFRADQKLETLLRTPHESSDEGNSWFTLIGDPSKVKSVKEQSLAQLDSIREYMLNDDFGLLTETVRMSKSLEEDERLRFMRDPYLRRLKTLKDQGGSSLVDSLAAQSEVAANYLQSSKSFVVGGGAAEGQPVSDGLKEVASHLNEDESAEVTRGAVNDLVKVMTSEEATTPILQNVAESLFGEGNARFLSEFDSIEDRRKVFHTLTTPQVTKRMTELKEADPEIWEKYRDWVMRGAISQFRTEAGAVSEGVVERDLVDIRFNSDTNQFEVFQNPDATIPDPLFTEENPVGFLGQGLFGLEAKYSADVVTGVKELNRLIRTVEPIVSEEGGDMKQAMSTLMQGWGIDTTAEKQPGMLTEMRTEGVIPALVNAVSQAFSEEESEGETGDSAPGKKPQSSPGGASRHEKTSGPGSAGFQEGAAVLSPDMFDEVSLRPYRPEDTVITDPEITTDSLEGVDPTPDSPLFSTIRNAEAPGDSYNRIQGTTQTVDLTGKTLGEIDELQAQMLRSGSESTAVGAYQIIRPTLRYLKRTLGLSDDTVFSEELQDQFALVLAQRRGLDSYMAGEITAEDFADRLAEEWAGLPLEGGESAYEGVGSNAATIPRENLIEALQALRDAGES